MALILNIDTALDTASVCLAQDDLILHQAKNENQKDHATWLHTAIADLLQKEGLTPKDLEAIAVSIGPGSYTGLRVGLASAKGLCYALKIPLITVNTLKLIAFTAQKEAETADFICSMIDARRMEVFTALYDKELIEKEPPSAMLIDESSFSELLRNKKIIFCGNGSKKLQKIISNSNATFSEIVAGASDLAHLSYNCFRNTEFADLAYTDPLYIKEFYSPTTRPN
jgi:tRNA threonylcarbamoyladenosine biosynthesis protein TsaB